jgi:hypothetical protein
LKLLPGLIVVPEDEKALARAMGEAHKQYRRMENFAEGVHGYLFPERFGSSVYGKKGLGIPVVEGKISRRQTKGGCFGRGSRFVGACGEMEKVSSRRGFRGRKGSAAR